MLLLTPRAHHPNPCVRSKGSKRCSKQVQKKTHREQEGQGTVALPGVRKSKLRGQNQRVFVGGAPRETFTPILVMGKDEKKPTRFEIDATKLRLPATEQFLAKTSLDEEERNAKSSLNFLKRMPKRKKTKRTVQGNWGALEAALKKTAPAAGKREIEESSDWHEMPEVKMTPELQRDLRIIENRQHLDPKRFYKSSGTGRRRGELPTRVQIGAVVVGAHEFYSGRLTNKERKGRIMDQVLADERIQEFTKNRFKKLQSDRMIQKRIVDPAAKKRRRRRRRGRW